MGARLFTAASILWVLLLALAAGPLAGSALDAVVLRFSSFICHQQPDRSFHWAGEPWAVCARCLGLYAAAPLGALHALSSRPAFRAGSRNFLLLCIAGIPTALTWLGEHVFGWEAVSNVTRFAAALPLGAAVAWIIARTLQYTLPDARRA